MKGTPVSDKWSETLKFGAISALSYKMSEIPLFAQRHILRYFGLTR